MALVTTQFGQIIGEKIAPKGLESVPVNRFLGIPFAEPPVGRLRFRKTVPWTKTWTTPFQAIHWPPQCPQSGNSKLNASTEKYTKNKEHSEDCLKLNIWSPADASETALKPVLVWIHGGGLVHGSVSIELYDGEYISAKMDVVVVAINYRLGSLGFFYSKAVPEICGNQGLWDQVTALQWVNANIKNFGGDPSRLTIMGQSAGAWSVSLHVLSPVSRDLFSNAIIMSGAATNIAAPPEVQMRHYCSALKKLGLASETDTEITAEMVKELEQMEVDKVVELYYLMERRNVMDRKSLVVIDGQFLPASPAEMLATGNYKKKLHLLSSVLEDEGSFLLAYTPFPFFKSSNPEPITYREAVGFLHKLINEMQPFESLDGQTAAIPTDLAVKFYFRGLDPAGSEPNEYRKRLGIALGDFWLGCATLNFAKDVVKHSEGGAEAYQWYYAARSENVKLLAPDWAGVTHGDELIPLFGLPFRFEKMFSDRDREVSADVVAFVGQFVRTGKPGPQWQSYYYTANNDLIAPYYEINNQAATSEHYQYNCKHIESELIWGKVGHQ